MIPGVKPLITAVAHRHILLRNPARAAIVSSVIKLPVRRNRLYHKRLVYSESRIIQVVEVVIPRIVQYRQVCGKNTDRGAVYGDAVFYLVHAHITPLSVCDHCRVIVLRHLISLCVILGSVISRIGCRRLVQCFIQSLSVNGLRHLL